jgi:hypothetical protein
MNISRSKSDEISKNRELTEFAQQFVSDQKKWFHQTMEAIAPEQVRDAIQRGDDKIVMDWIKATDLQLLHVFDQGKPCGLRLLQGTKIVAELKQQVTLDDLDRHPYLPN